MITLDEFNKLLKALDRHTAALERIATAVEQANEARVINVVYSDQDNKKGKE